MRMENDNILFAPCTERENAFDTCKSHFTRKYFKSLERLHDFPKSPSEIMVKTRTELHYFNPVYRVLTHPLI